MRTAILGCVVTLISAAALAQSPPTPPVEPTTPAAEPAATPAPSADALQNDRAPNDTADYRFNIDANNKNQASFDEWMAAQGIRIAGGAPKPAEPAATDPAAITAAATEPAPPAAAVATAPANGVAPVSAPVAPVSATPPTAPVAPVND
jgi:hypothetical protein